jgi:hypothetical protein
MPGIVVPGTVGGGCWNERESGGGFGAHPFGEIARATVAAQERSLELAQAWSDSLRELVADQAEGGRAALEALTSTLAATERALASQEEANRALRQSLEAYREVIDRASATQERNARLVQAALESFAALTQAQLELTRAFWSPWAASPRPWAAWSRAGTTPSCGCWRRPRAPGRDGRTGTELSPEGGRRRRPPRGGR